MTERITIRLAEELLRRAERKAVAEGTTLTALIEDGLRRVVAESGKPMTGRRNLPRVSKATGGLMPTVDLTQVRTLQEIDDLEYLERMKRFKAPRS